MRIMSKRTLAPSRAVTSAAAPSFKRYKSGSRECNPIHCQQASFMRLQETLERKRDNVRAAQMKKYMKDKFEYLGLQSPLRRSLYNEFKAEVNHKLETEDELLEWVELLWAQPYREFNYIAMDELILGKKILSSKGAAAVEHLISTSSWWDTVDLLASNILGSYYNTRPVEMEDKIRNYWSISNNMWLNRTGILVQLKHKQNIRLDLVDVAIQPHLTSSEFFHQKAIGWILREVSKTNPNWVAEYVRENTLKPLSVREALKFINIGK